MSLSWTVLVPSCSFLGEPSSLVQCAACGRHRRYVRCGALPTRCPVCDRARAEAEAGVDATPEDATPYTVPSGALAAGVCRVG